MPTYEYRCGACGHEFEEFQSMTAKPLLDCPRCKRKKLERLIGTGAALVFKGSGFYQTDYRSESYQKAADADKPASKDTKTDSKSSAKSEARPEPKAESKTSSNSEAKPKPEGKKSKKA